MTESQKEASSIVNSREKASMLDLDIGSDFLGSWKSMSMPADDTMDFDFGSIAKGKKSSFNFDKADMDFTLDGDFDKISAFKVDMSDLDISSSLKKVGIDSSKEQSDGRQNKAKADCFAFSFDFDDFHLDSNMINKEKSAKNQDKKGSSHQTVLSKDSEAIEDSMILKLPASGDTTISRINTQGGTAGNIDPANETGLLKLLANDKCPSTSSPNTNLVELDGSRTLPEKIISTGTEDVDIGQCQLEKMTSLEPHTQENIPDITIQSVSGNASIQDNAAQLQEEDKIGSETVNARKGTELGAIEKSIVGSSSNNEKSLPKNLPPETRASQHCNSDTGREFKGGNNVPTDSINDAESAQGNEHDDDISMTSVSRETGHDTEVTVCNQNSTSKLYAFPLNGETATDKLIPVEEREAGVAQPKILMSSDGMNYQLQNVPPIPKKLPLVGHKQIRTLRPSPAVETSQKNDDAATGLCRIKLARTLGLLSRESDNANPVKGGNQESIKYPNNVREGFSYDDMQMGSKLIGASRSNNGDATKEKPVLTGKEKKIKEHSNSCLHADLSGFSEQTAKSTQPSSVACRFSTLSMNSIQNLKSISVERNKISSPKAAKITSELSSLKMPRTVAANFEPSNHCSKKEIKSLKTSEENIEMHSNVSFKVATSVETEKRASPIPSLKRKAHETSNNDMLILNPLKRLSESPKENRINRLPSESVIDPKRDGRTNNILSGHKITSPDQPQEINMIELEIPLVMENDSNIEKAEACSKELEDICSMLKKKHKEAKDVLVRAIVNNNKLLMLNHPMYEEKIRVVQKFAAKLMSPELHA